MQKATVTLLNAIYEQDFLECSYGFRPGRGWAAALKDEKRAHEEYWSTHREYFVEL